MKRLIFHGVLLAFVFFCASSFRLPNEKARLTVQVKGIVKPTGTVRLILFDDPNTFMSKDGSCYDDNLPVGAEDKVTFEVDNLPAGSYAAALYQDVNNNGKLDMNIIHIPTEPYGFCNEYRTKWSIPSFAKVQFEVSEPNTEISTVLRPWSAQ
jgi:uncharacterized protein (DUF2141 family)